MRAVCLRLLPLWTEAQVMEIEYENGEIERLPLSQRKIIKKSLRVADGSVVASIPEVDSWE